MRNEIAVDPNKLPYIGAPIRYSPSRPLPQKWLRLLNMALSVLSPREREVYELVIGQGFSLSQAADLLNISKSSAATYLRRAKKKLIRFKEA